MIRELIVEVFMSSSCKVCWTLISAVGFSFLSDARCVAFDNGPIKPRPEIQAQIKLTLETLNRNYAEGFRELINLQNLERDQEELVRQLAYYAEHIREGEIGIKVLEVRFLLDRIDVPDAVIVSAMAPYVDASNESLRSFVRDWFQSLDRAHDTVPEPLVPINYKEYFVYISNRISQNEPIPEPFIKYIYDRQSTSAFLAFVYADSGHQKSKPGARTESIRKFRELLRYEHMIRNAIWYKENGFNTKYLDFKADAISAVRKLSNNENWWARLYAAKVIHDHLDVGSPDVIKRLQVDDNVLVRKASKGAGKLLDH